jgi:DNA polymerase delta subunit 1
MAYKLTANSLYGQLGSGSFKVRQQALAASVTAYGRKQILFAKSIIETYYGPDAGDPRCSAKIVYGDTDSFFVAFHPNDPESGTLLEGKESVQATIDLTEEAGKLVTQVLKPPHDFEFDKVYWPFLIFSKKRYVGHKYEHGPDSYVLTSMGIALKRRDYAAIVKKIYGGAINILLLEKNVPKAADFVRQMALELVEGKFGLGPLTISKSLKSEYANPNSIAHKVLADRITKRDPGNAPASGDRIQYIYVQAPTGQKAAKLQGDCIETPVYIREHGLKPDYMYYIEHQISNPVCQMFGLLLDQLPEGKSYTNSLSSDPIKAAVQRENIAYDLLFNKVSQVNSNGLKRAFLQMFGSSSSSNSTNPLLQTNKTMGQAQIQPVYTENKPKPKQSTLDSMFFDTMKINVFKESTKKKSSKKESVVGSIESLMV